MRLIGCCGVMLCLLAATSGVSPALSLGAVPPAGAVAGYGDVDEGRYFAEPVQWSVDDDVTGIEGTCFFPDAYASRGETALYLWNAEGRPEAGTEHSFDDVTVEAQHESISWMVEAGVTEGTSGTTFSPEDNLTRGQTAAFLWRLADRPAAANHPFVDVVKQWQQGAVSWLSETGITTGTSDTEFSPEAALTRKELITLLWRYKGKPAVTVDPNTPGCEPGVFTAVAAGGSHSCGLHGRGIIRCWGNDSWKQAEAPSGSFNAVSAGSGHSCGLRIDGTATCWGNDDYGQSDAPAGRFGLISAGSLHSCGVLSDGTIACWGNRGPPVTDVPTGRFSTVSAGWGFSCGLRTNGTIACWGADVWGQSDAPSGSFKAVSAGSAHSCGLRTNGTIACWGADVWGQSDAPSGSFKAVSAGSAHSCGLRTNGTIACWGNIDVRTADPADPPG